MIRVEVCAGSRPPAPDALTCLPVRIDSRRRRVHAGALPDLVQEAEEEEEEEGGPAGGSCGGGSLLLWGEVFLLLALWREAHGLSLLWWEDQLVESI